MSGFFRKSQSTKYSLVLVACILSVVFTAARTSSAEGRKPIPGRFDEPQGSCTPSDVIVDGGFENGGVPSTIWNDPQSSTNFGTPLCDLEFCGTGGGSAPPRTGAVWAWFGGVPMPEMANLGQNVTIPTGSAAVHFWLRIGAVSSPFTDVLNIKIDNVTVQSYPEPSTPETDYTERIIDLTQFADGAVHNIQFEYIGTSNGTASYVVDDVSLISVGPGCGSPSPTPTITPTATPAPTCTPPERIIDGTFEAGIPWTAWTEQTSTNFGSPICNTSLCGTDSGLAAPYAGDNWIWFGGITAAETSTVGQTVTIPLGAPTTLTFQLRIGKVATPFTDTLTVTMDGTTVAAFTEPSTAEAAYSLRSYDLSSFADGGTHALLFTYNGPSASAANFTVDDISIIANVVCATPTATSTPTNTPTPAGSPSITGTVTYGNAIGSPANRFVSNVLLNGAGSPNLFTTTGFPDGTYTLSGFGSGSYTVTPSKTGGVNGSITSFDAARIAQHVTGTNTLIGNQLIVADVSGNGTISSFDAAQIARYSVGIAGSGSTGNWIFMPANRNYPVVSGNITGQDFTALLMGEVSGNWTNTGARR
jgi:hypothetical protein